MRIVLDIPPAELSPNARVNWRTKASATKKARHAACILALEAGVPERPFRSASVQTFWYFARPNRRDHDNLLARCKAVFDGLVDAGVLADDDRIVHLPPQVDVDAANPRLEVVVEGE